MLVLRFDYRDLFRAPRLAFSAQRIWIQFLGMSVGYFIYVVLTYLAFLLNGNSLKDTWETFALVPCLFAASGTIAWYAWVVFFIAVVVLLVSFFIVNTAVARVTYMVAKGNHFYSSREGFRFALRKMGAILSTPASLVILLALIVLGSFILGLIGRIPYLGELFVGFFSLVWFVFALFVIYLGIVLIVSLFLTPSIIATTDEDAFEAVFQIFSITWGQPWRIIFYEAMAIILSILSTGVLAFFGKRAVVLTNVLLNSFMGNDYTVLSNNGQALVQNWVLAIEPVLKGVYQRFTPQIFFTNEFIYSPPDNFALTIASFLFALSLLCLGGCILAYGMSTLTIGNTLSYLVLRRKKDGENLLERRDKEEESEDTEIETIKNEEQGG